MSLEQMLFEQMSRLREHWFCHRFGIFAGIQIFRFFFSILPPVIFTDRSKAKKSGSVVIKLQRFSHKEILIARQKTH